ncbi:hypothetical protein ATE84_1836 [Aquimarina sp. MAR_2010_214]|uniref:hypothetical protein n=1 Tax=Aquimarina sp. MAR_2010_214 TaxID=1250026 RepID=UPI000CB952DF|nr:hypothetical protein [Aquimarina sp. MAR_2010_214]PKV49798.1 hypothetical protein ATE84_1836 [Aquimarina sp. MAR_2010_214]
MIRLILFLFLIISLQTFGQSETLQGKIMADSLQGYAINIVNFTKEIGTTNDEQGFFEIPASPGDSIVFSSVQYQIRSIIVKQDQIEDKKITIVLYPIVQQLEQVKISNIELSGNLDKDLGAVELQPFVDNRTLGLPFSDKPQPTKAERRIYTARSGIIDRPINYLSGKLKKLKRIKALEDLDVIVQKGETTFNTTFFIDELKLPEDLITDFMYYCAKDDYFKNLLTNSKRLTLVEFFQNKVISYKEHKELD